MSGIGKFEFNSIESDEFDLVCSSVQRPVRPTLRTRYSEIADKHGAIDHGGNKYAPRPLKMHISYIGTNYLELRSRAREIRAWLSTEEWSPLIINDEPDKYYLARVYDLIDIDTFQRLGQCDITFLCQPFAYAITDTSYDPTWEEADFTWLTDMPWIMSDMYMFSATGTTALDFDNPGTREISNDAPEGSKFKIEIAGSWTTLSLSLNGKTITYSEAGSGTLVIDNIEMDVTLGGVNKLDVVTGDLDSFLSVMPGTNTISVGGTGISISVQLDFIPMWI